MNSGVWALAVSGSDPYAGGGFTAAGGKVSAYLARAILEAPASPPFLRSPTFAGGVFSAWFTHTPGASFTARGTTNLSLPWSNWPPAGSVTEMSPGQFRFTDPQESNAVRRYCRLRSP